MSILSFLSKTTTNYWCPNCDNYFEGPNYNCYQYLEGSYQTCSHCKSKLVPKYNFRYIAHLDDMSTLFFCIALLIAGLVLYIDILGALWHLSYGIPLLIAALYSIKFMNELENANKKSQEMRLFENDTKDSEDYL